MEPAALLVLFATVSQTFNLPPGLLASLCYVESHYDVKAIHLDDGGSNSVGVCQVKLDTARTLGFKGTETLLRNPRINAYYAGRYLSNQLSRYVGNVSMGVAAYNSGTFRIGKDGNARNHKYVTKVMTAWKEQKK